MNLENHTQCPVCKQITLPMFTEMVIAVRCQNRECGVIIKKKEDKKKEEESAVERARRVVNDLVTKDLVKESKERFRILNFKI
jgi:hypothetical protein